MNKTLDYFKVMTSIPRPSGQEEKVLDYLKNFAKNHNLEFFFDSNKNILIKKKTNRKTPQNTLILQGHTDMVCEKEKDKNFDFTKNAINTVIRDGFLFADKTTLGADNGIGISMILSILDDDKISIPNLECVFTSEEETTMNGAINFDTSLLKGRHLLSIDGTEEGEVITSSAGMIVLKQTKDFSNTLINDTLNCSLEKEINIKNNEEINIYTINLLGFRGGHSGSDINSDRQNAIIILFKFLNELNKKIKKENNKICDKTLEKKSLCKSFNIVKINGGGKSNAIPRDCSISILAQNLDELYIKNQLNNFIKKYREIENNLLFEVIDENKKTFNIKNIHDTNQILGYVSKFKNGILVKSDEIKNFPIVSNNFANIKYENGKLEIIISLRSSNKKLETKFLNKIINNANKIDIKTEIISKAPFFEQKKQSTLQNICKQTYYNLYNKEVKVNGVHAGLEGGVFSQKIPSIDICVISPNIYDAHSPLEHVELSSIDRVYKWLEKIIENF